MNRIVGHYEILDKLGEGVMGIVYKARDVRLDRVVALKMFSGERVDSPQRERLIREARTASALNHPNIITIYEIDSSEGVEWIAMEYVAGRSLAQMVQPGGLPVIDVLRYGAQIASAASKAHAANIIHRDLKPANIMVTDEGVVKVLDFGLAKKYTLPGTDNGATVPAPLTTPGFIIGTVAYMSPEQAFGEFLDARSDIFSLGVILYELFSGIRPFVGSTTLVTLQKIQIESPASLKVHRPDLPDRIEEIIQRALQKDRRNRYQTMDQLRSDLLQAADEISDRAASRDRSGSFAHGAQFMWRYRKFAVALCLLVALLVSFNPTEKWLSSIRGTRETPAAVEPGSLPSSAMPASDWTIQAQTWLDRYDRTDNIARAIQAANKALERDAGNAMAYALLAEAYYFRNASTPDPQWNRLATESARKAVELNNDLAAAHLARGIAFLGAGQTGDAGPELERARELNPLNPAAYTWLGDYYSQSNDFTNAEVSYRRAIETSPEGWYAYGRFGTFLYRRTRYDEAIKMWEEALARTPDNVIILKNLGAAFHMLNQYEQAAKMFQRALEIQPTAAVYSNLGTARFFQGRYSDSAAAFEKAVGLNPSSYLYWGNLGDARRWTPGEAAKAKQAYAEAIRLVQEKIAGSPDDSDIRGSLCVYYAKAGDRQRALDSLEALEKLPNRTPASDFKATIAYEIAGNRRKALQALEAAIHSGYSLGEITNEPELTSLRTDRRYHEILSK